MIKIKELKKLIKNILNDIKKDQNNLSLDEYFIYYKTTYMIPEKGLIVESLIKKHINLYQFYYEVKDLKTSIKLIKSAKGFFIQCPKPAIVFENRLVTFLMKHLGLI